MWWKRFSSFLGDLKWVDLSMLFITTSIYVPEFLKRNERFVLPKAFWSGPWLGPFDLCVNPREKENWESELEKL